MHSVPIMRVCDASRMGNVVPFSVVEGPEAWTAADYKDPSQYIYVFSDTDLAELDAAVAAAAQLDKPIQVPPSYCHLELCNVTGRYPVGRNEYHHFCCWCLMHRCILSASA